MPFGPSFESELHAAGLWGLPFTWNAATGAVDDADLTEAQRNTLQAVVAAHDPTKPAPPPPVVLPVIDLYRKMTDAEYAAMQAGVATQSPRVQGIFARADNFRSDAPEWPLLVAMAKQLYGDSRAAELLSP